MHFSSDQLSRPAPRRRTIIGLTALTLIVAACRRDDPIPTAPLASSTPRPAVLGADITSLGFEVVAVNGSGQVAGTLNGRAVLWTPSGGMKDLGTLGGSSSRAFAINEAGYVAGASTTATGATHAFLWTSEQGMQDLGTLPGGTTSMARGINDHGEVVGQSTRPRVDPLDPRGPVVHAFRWTLALGMEDLGTLGALNSSIAYDINNEGQVVGRAYSIDRLIFPPTDPEYFSRAFLWADGQGMQDIGALSGGYSVAHAINDAGTIVGRSWVSSPTSIVFHAFRWTPAAGVQDLGAFAWSSDSSAAMGVNNAGQIVGWSKVGAGPFTQTHAFIWTESEGLESLTPTTGISRASAINDHLQVVGDGRVAKVQLGPGNVPPVVQVGGPYTALEGSKVAFDVYATDLDGGRLWGQAEYGDGSSDIIDMLLPIVWRPVGHVYMDDGTYTFRVIAIDARDGRDTTTAGVTIVNVAPTIAAGSLTGPTTPLELTGGGVSAPIAFEFRDPAGVSDVYAAEVSCGNGVVLTPTNIPVSNEYNSSGEYLGGKGTYAGTCTYASAGVYTVRAVVSDEDGGTSAPAFHRYVVVYDPAGASVSGSGFYAVPGEARRKAHFKLDVGYGPGQPMPNGSARLWVPGGQLNFVSTAIEMLVAAGNRAQFWGTGIADGAAVRFRITVVDGPVGAIRVELWDASGSTLLLDTQPGAAQDAPVTTSLEGGNVRVR